MMKVVALNLLHWGNQVVEESEQAEHKGAEFILEELGNPVIIPIPKIFGVDLSITKAALVMWIASVVTILSAMFMGWQFRGSSGPDLAKIRRERDVDWLTGFLIDPTTENPDSDMPSYDYRTGEEMEALLAYLQTLK